VKKLKNALAGIGAALVFLAGWFFRGLFARKTVPAVIKTPEEVKLEIENTPACDLVASASNADQLRANADGIAERAKQRLRDRAGTILSGDADSGTDGSGGSGN
jgi:hypothetical protein